MPVRCRLTEKLRAKLHNALNIDFMFFLLDKEDEGHPDAVIWRDNPHMQEDATSNTDPEGNPLPGRPARGQSIGIRTSYSMLRQRAGLTAAVQVSLIKDLVQEFCDTDPQACHFHQCLRCSVPGAPAVTFPVAFHVTAHLYCLQAMMELTDLWIRDVARGLRDCSVELEHTQLRLGDLLPPSCEYKRMHRDQDLAKKGHPAENSTPNVIVKWTGRPGLPALHASDLSYVNAVWHERCFAVATPDEICDATDEEMEQLQCRNAKEARRVAMGLGQEQDVSMDEEEEDRDGDDETGDIECSVRVHVVDIHERIRAQFQDAANRWLKPVHAEEATEVCTLY